MKVGKYDVLEIREDDEGDLWFLIGFWSESESWWVLLSDEYGGPESWNQAPSPKQLWKFEKVRSEDGKDQV